MPTATPSTSAVFSGAALGEKRPAVAVAILLVVGIAVHDHVPIAPALWLALAALCIVVAVIFQKRTLAAEGAIGGAIVLAGLVSSQLFASYFSRHHIGLFASRDTKLACVEAVIETPPRLSAPNPARHLPSEMSLETRAVRVMTQRGWEPASGSLPVTVAQPVDGLHAGQRVRLVGMLQRPIPTSNPGQFDWAQFYRAHRVLAEMRIPHGSGVESLETSAGRSSNGSPLRSLRDRARQLLSLGFTPHSTDGLLLEALVFGDRQPELRPVEEAFRITGTSHLLASTGLRVALLAACLYLLCRLCFLSPRVSVIIVTCVVGGWGLMTTPNAQAIRPLLVCVAAGFAAWSRRRVDGLQLLALAAIAILLLNPLDLYAAGFQLGFVTVLGMMLLIRPITRWIEAMTSSHARVARRIEQAAGRASLARRARWKLGGMARDAAIAGGVAWVVSTPLVIYHFEQFNPWAIAVGLLLTPLVFASVVGGFLKVAMTAVLPSGAGFFAWCAAFPTSALQHAVAWAAKTPGADIPFGAPPVWWVFASYAALCVPLVAPWLASHPLLNFSNSTTEARPLAWLRRYALCTPFGVCLMLTPMLGPTSRVGSHPAGGELRVCLLDVGAGQCAVIRTPAGRTLLFDAGSSTLSDPLRTCIAPFLRHEGRGRIDQIFLSHGDFDHISAVFDAVPAYGAREVLTSAHFRRHATESAPAQSLLDMLDRTGRTPTILVAGTTMDLGEGCHVEVLWPPAGCTMNSNNAGLVLRLDYGGRSILFPADIQEPAERELLKLPPGALHADVLIAPHHGSREVTTPQFIRAVAPSIIISSNGARLTMKQRTFEDAARGISLLRTSRVGAITVSIDGDGAVQITPFHPRPPTPAAVQLPALKKAA